METLFILQDKDGPFQKPLNSEEEKAIDQAMGLNKHIVRLDNETNDRLIEAAQKKGLVPQAYLRQIVEEHLNKVS